MLFPKIIKNVTVENRMLEIEKLKIGKSKNEDEIWTEMA